MFEEREVGYSWWKQITDGIQVPGWQKALACHPNKKVNKGE
jgi:hypothetical protein